MTSPTTAAAVVLLALLLPAGCQDPYATDQRAPSDRGARLGDRAVGDEPAPAAEAGGRGAPAFSPRQAAATARAGLAAFCSQWANWSWRTIERQQARLGQLATGPLARQLKRQTQSHRLDRGLRRERLATRGQVVALDLKPRRGQGRRGVCVTREHELRNGRSRLDSGQHRVYLAELERGSNGWGVSAWESQP